jgi:hypothetical protein
MKKFFLVFSLLFLFFTSSNALANTSKCELNLDSFTKYKSNLIKCLDNENLELNEKISKKINKLSIEKTNYLSNDFLKNEKFIVKDKLVVSDKFNNYLSSTINKNSQDIYGIHNELNNLRLQNTISDQGYDKLVDQSLGDFVNSIYNPNQSLANSNVVAAIGIAVAATALTDDEDEPSKLNFSLSSSSATENGGTTITLTATAEDNVNSDTKVNFTLSGDATSGTDYSVAATFVTISSGSKTASTTFTITDDSVYEGNETITFTSSTITGDDGYINESTAISFTITENESAPVITMNFNNCSSFTAISTTVAENASGLHCITTFTSQIADEDITVNVSLGGTADTSDYSSDYLSRGYITIDANSTQSSFSFDPSTDSINEENETLIVSISSVSGADATESGTQSETITITDTTTDTTVSFAASASSIAENSGSSITITATLSAATYEDVTISLSTSGTSTEGTDYGTISDITVSAGSTTGTASFTPTDDTTYEGNETAIIDISGVSGGGASESGTQQLTLTITENESSPTVSLSSSATTVFDNGSDITFTATATQISDEDITVTIGTSGTATEGTDYASVSDITISAGATTGTTTFNPTSDTINEGSETATIAISAVSGADAATSGTTSITITITEYALRTATAFTEGSTSDQNAIKAETQWTNVDATGSSSVVHPYELMNIHKVQSFSSSGVSLTGEGETIHIADFNCDDNHLIYGNKTILNLDDGGVGESTFDNATSSTNPNRHHCQMVASFAAGDGTGTGDVSGQNLVSGVAPDADIVLSSIPNTEGSEDTDDYARDLDAARAAGAVVSNNSWGLASGINVTEAKASISSNGWSNIEGLSEVMEGGRTSAETAAAQLWVDALDNFQASGVIVWSAGNDNTESDVDAIAGLPEFFPELAEAWIVVNWSDFTGSSLSGASESDFTLHGNKCGSAKEYCLTADGTELNGGGWIVGSTHHYGTNQNGSSYSAPMVAGGVALMAQAFPNHTPEQLTDRILASANNAWFTPEGNTTFTSHGNSIKHGYHSDWGHGVPDFYAALSPITTNANPASFIMSSSLSEGYKNQSQRHSVSSSSMQLSSALSSSGLSQGIKGTNAYFYDALGGGFEYDLSNIVYEKSKVNYLSKIDIKHQLVDLRNYHTNQNVTSPDVYQGEYMNFKDENNTGLSLSINNPNIVAQKFNLFEQSNYQGDDFMKVKGLSLNNFISIGDSNLVFSYSDSTIDPSLEVNDKVQSLMASLDLFPKDGDKNLILTTGAVLEKDTLLFTESNGAMNLGNEETISNIFGINYQKTINDNSDLTFNTLLTYTAPKQFENSLVSKTDNLFTSRFNVSYNIKNIFNDNEKIKFSISQPTRVEKGNMQFKLPGLADKNGNIPYNYEDLSLKPEKRQIDFEIKYMRNLKENIYLSVGGGINKNANHSSDSLNSSLSTSFLYKF